MKRLILLLVITLSSSVLPGCHIAPTADRVCQCNSFIKARR
ncbi:hypothetical protein [Sodalis-like endosymbiont of Proechinophthirus fluctus]|nr:hypothetical protein [Sodalis-like endosymbiont of Proechinophthirus fluctus]